MREFEFHPLANIFPLIEGEEFAALVADIKQNGLLDAITLCDGKIIDGRNRYRAMVELTREIPTYLLHDETENFLTEDIALSWVLSKNLHRRHLSESQRAMVAGKIANMKQGERTDKVHGADEPSANLPKVSNSDAGKRLNVSERSVRTAKAVINKGTEELNKAVTSGEIKVSAAAVIADLPQEEQVKLIESADKKALAKVVKKQREEKMIAKKQKRDAREKELGDKQISLPDAKYGVIYADPEWKFKTYGAVTGMSRSADNHYPTSSLEEIKARKVADIAAKDCVLFLWATAPMLPQALEVMKAWGFEYKSHFVWVKDKMGTGYWNRNKHELLLVGTKGNVPAPAMGTQWSSTILDCALRHSQKPNIFYEIIENYFPSLPKIELNARAARDGWTAWGLEAPDSEISEDENFSNSDNELYNKAVSFVLSEKRVSLSSLQRHLRIGFPRASGFLERLESEGVISVANHIGRREVLAGDDDENKSQAKAGNDTLATDAANVEPVSRGDDARSSSATSEIMDVTAGETAPQNINEIIEQGYAAMLSLEEIAKKADISKNAVQKRATRLGLSSPERQKQAVVASNKRRVKR